jgi:hypothetical protein
MYEAKITLGPDVQEDFDSWIECCYSLGVSPRVNSFLYYVSEYGTYANPKEENGSNGI